MSADVSPAKPVTHRIETPDRLFAEEYVRRGWIVVTANERRIVLGWPEDLCRSRPAASGQAVSTAVEAAPAFPQAD